MVKPSETSIKIASNTIYQIVGKVVSMTITIIATVLVVRMYGREFYGEFNLMQTFPALFFIIVDFGFNAIATRELSGNWEKVEKYLGNILLLRVGLALLVMTLSGIALIFFPYAAGLKFGIYLSLFLILTQALYATTNVVFQVKLRYDLSTIGYVTGSIIILLSVLLLTYFRAPVMWVNFSYVVGGLVTFVINVFYIKRLGVRVKFAYDKDLVRFLFIQSLPLGLMFIFSQVNFKVDSIFISILNLPARYGLNNTESVGVYGLPYKVFEVSLVVPTFFMNAAYPVLVRHMNESRERLKETFFKVITALSVGGIIFGLIGIVIAPLIIRLLGGEPFSQSVPVLRVLLGGLVLFYSTQPISWLIVTLGGQKYLPLVYFVSAVFNIVANLLVIPLYSFYGSSVITLLSEVIILILLVYFARKVWKQKYA
ncbi:hypothetical protein A2976_01525 [candidate division WWE3 bacterium RIFCSPLOWO2_01_FULL_41_9]|uniref:Uncharacterized protein n=1 Tax=candidate division WWE3 bacterium RIFCSPLOWO2_01_FULL_41_9 TaxID=1802626 RepID=A0A1F4VHL4_UNCKA|nr:MAG: hypothetical protein A2976_01525 [candidate division WWE3 bacterium RIFCSPLOWO2_01_FULL_41_9]